MQYKRRFSERLPSLRRDEPETKGRALTDERSSCAETNQKSSVCNGNQGVCPSTVRLQRRLRCLQARRKVGPNTKCSRFAVIDGCVSPGRPSSVFRSLHVLCPTRFAKHERLLVEAVGDSRTRTAQRQGVRGGRSERGAEEDLQASGARLGEAISRRQHVHRNRFTLPTTS